MEINLKYNYAKFGDEEIVPSALQGNQELQKKTKGKLYCPCGECQLTFVKESTLRRSHFRSRTLSCDFLNKYGSTGETEAHMRAKLDFASKVRFVDRQCGNTHRACHMPACTLVTIDPAWAYRNEYRYYDKTGKRSAFLLTGAFVDDNFNLRVAIGIYETHSIEGNKREDIIALAKTDGFEYVEVCAEHVNSLPFGENRIAVRDCCDDRLPPLCSGCRDAKMCARVATEVAYQAASSAQQASEACSKYYNLHTGHVATAARAAANDLSEANLKAYCEANSIYATAISKAKLGELSDEERCAAVDALNKHAADSQARHGGSSSWRGKLSADSYRRMASQVDDAYVG